MCWGWGHPTPPSELIWPNTMPTRPPPPLPPSPPHAHTPSSELIWPNTPLTTPMRSSKDTSMWIVFWLMSLFFMIPVVALQVGAGGLGGEGGSSAVQRVGGA